MVVTINGDNYLQISSFDTVTTGGAWSGQTPGTDDVTYKEGAGSVGFVMKTSGLNTTTFTPTTSKDLSGVKHVRFWMLSTHGGDFVQIELGITDGGNTGYWVLATSTQYPGGWYSCMIDVSKGVHSGIKPTNMNAITSFIFRVTLTGGKNATNFWLDSLIHCDGLIAYGDLSGSPFDVDDIYTTGISEATGIIERYGKVYFLTGKLIIGDTGTNIVDFQSLNEWLVFKDKSAYLNSALYSITCVGNATGATQDIYFGEKSGNAGINGSFIKCNIASMAFEFTATNTDLHYFGLYGSTLDTYGTIDLMAYSSTYEVLGCYFLNGQGPIEPNTMTFTGNFVIGGIDTDGSVLYESTSHNISYTTYVDNSRAAEFPTANTYDMTGDLFIGGTYDIHFSALTGNLILECGGSPKANPNPAQVENDSTGTVTINNVVDITVTVRDANDESLISGALVYMRASSASGDYPYQVSVGITSSGTTATVDHTSHGLADNEYVLIAGCNEEEYNGVHQITVSDSATYTYTMDGDPADTATGSPIATFVLIFDTTVSGVVTDTMRYLTLDQPFTGKVRKSSASPYYKTAPLSGTVENADFATTVYMSADE